MKKKEISRLNRYTTLPVLLDLLQRRKITLLNPELWEDKNDSEIILEYKRRKNIKKLFAICFSLGDETVHHWKTFSNGVSGCCIEFDAQGLLRIIDKIPGTKHGEIEYKKLNEVERDRVPLNRIPFTKRWPYRCEEEYRVILETDTNDDFFDINIPLEIITRITISQQMPDQIYQTIKGYLTGIKENPYSKINKSTLYVNKRWIASFTN